MPSQPPTTETRWVKAIDQVSSEDTPQVGGKAANLGELWHARFPVPSGFVVVADGYLDAVTEGGVRELLRVESAPGRNAAYKDLSELAESRASLIRELAVPPQMRAEIVSAYRKLGDSVRVAVRSSAPAEDGADTSFAGIHESYTNVIGDDAVVDAVRKCWESLWSERALSYRSERRLGEEPSIAVVVQTMVDADCAGVVFTADPRTGARDHVVIEAARGLGEVVVGGQVEPDVYEVAKADFRVLAVHLGAQSFEITSGDSGDKRVELTDDDRSRRVLDDSQLSRIALMACSIENHYGTPQDLEFAISGERLWVVQTRPITTLDMHTPSVAEPQPVVTEQEPARKQEILVQGLGAGPGSVTGRVRVLRSLEDSSKLSEGEVLVAPMTRPDWLPVLRRAAAIVTDGGGITCHAAIVGRELGRPVVVGARTATVDLKDGQLVTVDGDSGAVLDGAGAPAAKPVAASGVVEARQGARRVTEPTATSLYVNLASPDAAERVAAMDVDGVGLLRAEFMVTEALKGQHPTYMIAQGRREEYVAQMADGVGRIAAAFAPRPVVYRAIDLRSNEFAGLIGGEVEPVEDNPMIGYRGCFRYVRDPELFSLDLDVLHRVRERLDNVHLMIPFVRTRWELEQCLAQLDAHPLGHDRRMLRWIMAEVPSVAYWIPEYARMGIHGVSIGTNDLTQLTLGVDRDSELCKDVFDTQDPAVLDAIDRILERAELAGLTTSLCGQAVSNDPALVEHLIRRGITSVSVTPDSADATRRVIAATERRILLDQARA